MGFLGIYSRRSNTTKQVYSLGDRFDMQRVDATRPSAQMIANQFPRDDRNKTLIHHSMGRLFAVDVMDVSVSIMKIILPVPTRLALVEMFSGHLNLGKETCKKFSIYGKSVRIRVGHEIFSYIENGLARLVRGASRLARAVLILPQVMQKSVDMMPISVVTEVC